MTMTTTEIDLRGARLSLLAGEALSQNVIARIAEGGNGYVCISNAHQVTEAWRTPDFRAVLDAATWVSTDSRVLELSVQALGHSYPGPVLYGSELMHDLCARAEAGGVPIGLFGGSDSVLSMMTERLRAAFPNLVVVYSSSPPVSSADELASERIVSEINASGARLLLVGLGCPKQERWMHLTAGRLGAVAVGLGAAFDFYAGEKRRSPYWIRRCGLDWLWRLLSEPGRLWRRYLLGNSRYLLGLLPEVVRHRSHRRE